MNQKQATTANLILRVLGTLLALWLCWQAGADFARIIQQNASKLGRYEFLGTVAIVLAVIALAGLLLLVGVTIWQSARLQRVKGRLAAWRERLGSWRWVLLAVVLLLPLIFLQYTPVGFYLTGHYLRLMVLLSMGLAAGVLLTRDPKRLARAPSLVVGFLLTATIFTLGRTFEYLSSYPFSLHWSEGNRFWDYSIMFGRRIYDYPLDQPIFAYIDRGRQSLWGLPFLFGNISIWQMRLWNALVLTLPYAILGWVIFRKKPDNRLLWLLAGLWALTFLSQGPIYTPLVLCAILVALAWYCPFWLALPLIALVGYYAQLSRFTWMFAPAIWAGMFYLADITGANGKRELLRRFSLAVGAVVAGLAGGYVIPRWSSITQLLNPVQIATSSSTAKPDIVSLEGVQSMVSRQPLLWERLLPNPTFGPGILLVLLLAVGPLVIYLIYLLRTRRWKLDWLGGLAVLGGLSVFLAVGLVVSVKIGGGSNLHNLDMFLLALVFTAALVWKQGNYRSLLHLESEPVWIQALWVLMMIIFAYQPVIATEPLRKAPDGMAQEALTQIRKEVASAKEKGEVLFLDQRQLLTFGYIRDVPLVDDYEKKYLMDQALSADASYFQQFYEDLARARFALIVSEPLKVNLQGSAYSFGEENDAWVTWVSKPVLCYYEPVATFKRVHVELLKPRENPINCP